MTASDVPSEGKALVPEESVVGAYFGRLANLLESEKDTKHAALAVAHRMGSKHFMAAVETMSEMDRLQCEMRSVLSEFTGREYFLARMLTIEHLGTAMKVYVISWHTMLDLLGRLVNVVFNLGIADRDVTVTLVLNNDHVRRSRIPGMFREYESSLLIKDLRKRRNDAVHRGRIPDSDVEQLLRDRNTIDSRRYSLLASNPLSEEEYKERASLLQARLAAMAKEKQDLWTRLHQQTIVMTAAIAGELAVKTIEAYKREVI